ncbi:unnamed protein product [Bursaphelenchus okinawaensis]|uniref:guanylate cyclase n=1 Tax=Bursaphelenchus okinawaensis TaxID=465554 RepID=A0A811K0B2_9BILA|nr:unnamed protein product [Bursaphelenchus okinawaensis]CAG9088977.1 unnamed protein product [Bursaphelenchus okinawaensis]
MFGLIHDSIRQLFIKTYGEEFWKKAMLQAGFESGKENIVNHYYPDSDTYAIVDAVSALAKITREDVWEMYGIQLIAYTMELGWDELMRYLSPDLKTFLNNLDSLHYFIDHVVYKANLRGPSFRCEENDDDTITLHYFTGRAGLYPIVKGVIREVARRIFNIEVTMTVSGRTQRSVQVASGERIEEHVVFIIKQVTPGSESQTSARSLTGYNVVQPQIEISTDWDLKITQTDFVNLLPYHFVMDRDCKLLQIGKALAGHITPDLLQYLTPVVRIFEIHRPQIPLDFENICNFINGVFVLQVRTSPLSISQNQTGKEGDELQAQHLKLKGQMMLMSGNDKIIYLCSPYVTSIPELLQYGLRLSAMPLHDATRDLILLNQQRLSDVEANLQLEANNEKLEVMAKELEHEKQKTDELLKEVLPASVAEQLMNGSAVDAKEFQAVTVMFTDVPGFQNVVALCKPTQIVSMLNDLFTKCDRLVTMHELSLTID